MGLKCLLIFGQKFGNQDNPALIALGNKIAAMGVEIECARWNAHRSFNQEIIIAHSFGARSAIEWNIQFSNIASFNVKYLALIDPVADWFPIQIWNYWKKFTIPSNIQKSDCFTRSWNIVPPSGSIANPSANYVNYPNINSSHADIPNNDFVSKTILKAIQEIK